MPITPEHELQEISFRPAQGGLISETRHKTAGGKFGPDYKSETAVHSSLGHAVRHLKSALESSGKKMKKKEGDGMRREKSGNSMKARAW